MLVASSGLSAEAGTPTLGLRTGRRHAETCLPSTGRDAQHRWGSGPGHNPPLPSEPVADLRDLRPSRSAHGVGRRPQRKKVVGAGVAEEGPKEVGKGAPKPLPFPLWRQTSLPGLGLGAEVAGRRADTDRKGREG